jgi:hypothetical protein
LQQVWVDMQHLLPQHFCPVAQQVLVAAQQTDS